MSNRTDVYRAFTPLGMVEVEFPEDGGSIFTGAAVAVEHVQMVMSLATNAMGMTMTPASLEPDDFVAFCQPIGSHITIIPPVDFYDDEVRSRQLASRTEAVGGA